MLSRCKSEVRHVAGNHDLINLTEDDLLAFWGADRARSTIRSIAAACTSSCSTRARRKDVERAHRRRAARVARGDLAAATRSAIVLMHHTAAEQDIAQQPLVLPGAAPLQGRGAAGASARIIESSEESDRASSTVTFTGTTSTCATASRTSRCRASSRTSTTTRPAARRRTRGLPSVGQAADRRDRGQRSGALPDRARLDRLTTE